MSRRRCCCGPSCDIFSVTEADTSNFETVGIWTVIKQELPANLFAIDISSRYIPLDGEMEYAMLDGDDNVVVKWRCGYSVTYDPGDPEDLSFPPYYLHQKHGEVTFDGETKTTVSGFRRDYTVTAWDVGHQFAARPDTSLLYDPDNVLVAGHARRVLGDFDHISTGDELTDENTYQAERGFAIPVRDIASLGPLRFAYRFIEDATSPSGLFAHTFIATWLLQEEIDTSDSEGLSGEGDASGASGGCEDQEGLNLTCTDIRPYPVTNPFYLLPRHIMQIEDVDAFDGSYVAGSREVMGDPPDYNRRLRYVSESKDMEIISQPYAGQETSLVSYPEGAPLPDDVMDEFIVDYDGDNSVWSEMRDVANYSVVNSVIDSWPFTSSAEASWNFLATDDPCVWLLSGTASVTVAGVAKGDSFDDGESRDREISLRTPVFFNYGFPSQVIYIEEGENLIEFDESWILQNYNALARTNYALSFAFEKEVLSWTGEPPEIEVGPEDITSGGVTGGGGANTEAFWCDWRYEFDRFEFVHNGNSATDLYSIWKRKMVEFDVNRIRLTLRPDDTEILWHP